MWYKTAHTLLSLTGLMILMVLILPYTSKSEESVIQLGAGIDFVDVQQVGYSYYTDLTQSLTLSQVRRLESCFLDKKDQKGFAPLQQNVWTHIQLSYIGEEEATDAVLELAHAHIAEYQLYILEGDRLILDRMQGDNFPYGDREIQHNFFLHRISLDRDKVYDVYYKINQEGQETPFPLNIYTESSYSKVNISRKLFHGFVLGLCLITSLVTLALFLVFRRRFYLVEVGVSVFSLLYILAEEGYGFMLIWPDSPYFNGVSRPFFVASMLLLSLWFTIDFLQIKTKYPKIYIISICNAGVYVFYLMLFHPFNLLGFRVESTVGLIVTIFMILTALNSLMIIYLSCLSWYKEKNKDGLVIFGVFLITLILVVVRTLGMEGVFPDSELIRHTGFITRGLHIPIIGIYLVYNAIEMLQESKNVQIDLLQEKSDANTKIVNRINEERRRVSMALHDSVGSTITGLKSNYEMLDHSVPSLGESKYYKEGLKMLKRLNDEVRTISNNLYPNTLQKLGLQDEVKRLLSEVKEIHNLDTHFEVIHEPMGNLDKDLQLQLYYIIRESVDNAVTHAMAKNIWVQCNYFDDQLNIIIEDDGCGFDLNVAVDKGRSGLHNLYYRIKMIDGDIDIFSEPNKGTSITINVPIKEHQQVGPKD